MKTAVATEEPKPRGFVLERDVPIYALAGVRMILKDKRVVPIRFDRQAPGHGKLVVVRFDEQNECPSGGRWTIYTAYLSKWGLDSTEMPDLYWEGYA